MKCILLCGAVLLWSGTAALAAHNNPWAGPDNTVQSKNHDSNQTRSVGKPGTDRMNGSMDRNDAGRTGGGYGGAGPADGSGHKGGAASGGKKGGHGKKGNGRGRSRD